MTTKIANKEKLSQSKVVGILVEEALLAREGSDLKNSNELIRRNPYSSKNNSDNSFFNHYDLDELMSDKGITSNTKKYNYTANINSSETRENFNEDLFEQFKQTILFFLNDER